MKLKLTYFNFRGRAEPTRLLFAAAGVPYEDVRVTKEEWATMKAENKTIMGQLPVLEVDGVQYAESLAIFRLVAKVTKLCPSCDFETARCDMVVDAISDLTTKASSFWFEKDEERKKTLQEKFKNEHVPHFMETMEKLLTAKCNFGGKADYMVGNKLSYADILLFNAFDNMLPHHPDLLDNYPGMKGLYQRVSDNPGIKEWLEKRPKTDM